MIYDFFKHKISIDPELPLDPECTFVDTSTLTNATKPTEPDDDCSNPEVICTNSTEELNTAIMCEKDPFALGCPLAGDDIPPPESPEDQSKKIAMYCLYGCAGLLAFTVIYSNLMGSDGNAIVLLAAMLKEDDEVLPDNAVDASEFLAMAGFDEDQVFDRHNPDPVLVAAAELSLNKMLHAMKQ